MVHTRYLGRGKQVGRFVDEWAEHERECPSLLGLGPLGYLPCLPPARVCRNRHVRQPSPASVTSSTLVAGFDFDFRYGSSQDLLLKVCLDAARSRARRLQVCWRSERLGAEGLRCVINGNGRRLDLLAHALERDLPLVAEGAAHAGLTAGRRRQLGVGFADLYVRGRDTRSHGPWQWRGAAHTRYYFAPYDVAHPGGPIALSARLRVTESVVIDWCFDRVPAVVLLEELHTACEPLLEHLVDQRSKRLSFAELVKRASDAGLLSWPRLPIEVPGFPFIGGEELLIKLKDYRKNARHSGDLSFGAWLRESWEVIALLIERLAEADPVPERTRSEPR